MSLVTILLIVAGLALLIAGAEALVTVYVLAQSVLHHLRKRGLSN